MTVFSSLPIMTDIFVVDSKFQHR